MKKLVLTMSLLSFLGLTAQAEPLAVGAPAPDLKAVDQDGKTLNFKNVYAKGPTLVYFYPKADTPGCTKEGCSLRDSWGDLQGKGIQVIGVSEDKPGKQKAFRDKFNFPFPLVADADGAVAKAFGVPVTLGFASRQSFLIKDGKVAWNMLKASTSTHGADVLKAASELK